MLLVCACVSNPDDKDMTMPFIEDSEESYPQQCEVYQPGGVIPLRCTFSDDMELGNFNVEIHNNFDHHTHSTSAVECDYDDDDDDTDSDTHNAHTAKTAKTAHIAHIAQTAQTAHDDDHDSIPAGQTLYKAVVDIPIPEDAEEGDYHFMIRLTDRTGWQQLKSVSIKIRR